MSAQIFLQFIGYTAAALGGLVAVYVAARFIFTAWFLSKAEHERTQHGTQPAPRTRTR